MPVLTSELRDGEPGSGTQHLCHDEIRPGRGKDIGHFLFTDPFIHQAVPCDRHDGEEGRRKKVSHHVSQHAAHRVAG